MKTDYDAVARKIALVHYTPRASIKLLLLTNQIADALTEHTKKLGDEINVLMECMTTLKTYACSACLENKKTIEVALAKLEQIRGKNEQR